MHRAGWHCTASPLGRRAVTSSCQTCDSSLKKDGTTRLSIVGSQAPFSSHQGTVGHRDSSPLDCYSNTRQVVMRAAASLTAVRVRHRPEVDKYRGRHRDKHKDIHTATSMVPIPRMARLRCRLPRARRGNHAHRGNRAHRGNHAHRGSQRLCPQTHRQRARALGWHWRRALLSG